MCDSSMSNSFSFCIPIYVVTSVHVCSVHMAGSMYRWLGLLRSSTLEEEMSLSGLMEDANPGGFRKDPPLRKDPHCLAVYWM